MKILSLSILLFFCISAHAETPWEKYLLLPTPENANAVKKIEYTKGAMPKNYGYWYPDLILVKNQINAGDSASLNLAIRLLKTTNGGALDEDLSGVIASAIRSRPRMFLTAISKSGLSTQDIKFILNYTGDEYVDRLSAVKYEIKMRKKTISSVDDNNLQGIKKTCLGLFANY